MTVAAAHDGGIPVRVFRPRSDSIHCDTSGCDKKCISRPERHPTLHTTTRVRAHSTVAPAVQVLHIRGQRHDRLEARDDDATGHGCPDELVSTDRHAADGLAEGHHGGLRVQGRGCHLFEYAAQRQGTRLTQTLLKSEHSP